MLLTEPEACLIPRFEPWRVLCCKAQHEHTVAEHLRTQGFEYYLPTYQVKRRWHDRKIELDLPLFKGYVFSRFDYDARVEIVRTFGVLSILSFGGQPAIVSDQEIATVRDILASGLPCEPVPLQLGQQVEIVCGPLVGQTGVLKKFKGEARLIVTMQAMNRAVAVQINREWARPLKIAA